MPLAMLDGTIGDDAETRIPVSDDGLLRGDGAFEIVRLYAGEPFALEEHLARLERSAAGLRLPVDFAALRRELAALLAATPAEDGLVRIVLTRGGRRIGLVEPLPSRLAVKRLATITYAPDRLLDGLKTLSYAANQLASRLAVERGADDALLVTPHGRVLEGPRWTFFWVDPDGALCTPPLADRILASITRAHVLSACDATERICTLDDLRAAREAFVASTVQEITPIASIDALALPAVPGPVTQEATRRLAERIGAELSAPSSAA